MIQRIATAAVYVEDQKRAVDFWMNKVGFELRADRPMTPEASWIEVAPPGAESCLVLYPRALMTTWAEMKPSIVFVCDDARKTYDEMKSRGVHFLEQPQQMAWGTFVRFADDDGNEFLLKS